MPEKVSVSFTAPIYMPDLKRRIRAFETLFGVEPKLLVCGDWSDSRSGAAVWAHMRNYPAEIHGQRLIVTFDSDESWLDLWRPYTPKGGVAPRVTLHAERVAT